MTLYEMSYAYGAEARRLKLRISALRVEERTAAPERRAALERRITDLLLLKRQARELEELTRHYYERGYHRDERYTL